jgi:hypothetical protein
MSPRSDLFSLHRPLKSLDGPWNPHVVCDIDGCVNPHILGHRPVIVGLPCRGNKIETIDKPVAYVGLVTPTEKNQNTWRQEVTVTTLPLLRVAELLPWLLGCSDDDPEYQTASLDRRG